MIKYTTKQAMQDYYDEIASEQIMQDEEREQAIQDYYNEMANQYDYDFDYAKEEEALYTFYKEHIQGKEMPKGLSGYILYSYVHEMWSVSEEKDKYTYLYDFASSDEFLNKAVKKFGKSKATILYALNLVEDYGLYSDWYKDIYGVRPR